MILLLTQFIEVNLKLLLNGKVKNDVIINDTSKANSSSKTSKFYMPICIAIDHSVHENIKFSRVYFEKVKHLTVYIYLLGGGSTLLKAIHTNKAQDKHSPRL